MERFVQLIVGGGVMLVVGLWISWFVGFGSYIWFVSIVVALVGLVGVLVGVWMEVEVGVFSSG